MIGRRGVVVIAAVLAVFLCLKSAHGHDIYMDWKNPETGMSCCSERDCYSTSAKFENGHWLALRREDQKWMVIPDSAVLKDGVTPEGDAHLCAPAPYTAEGNRIYCFRPPWYGG